MTQKQAYRLQWVHVAEVRLVINTRGRRELLEPFRVIPTVKQTTALTTTVAIFL
jgi:hypothetical protein